MTRCDLTAGSENQSHVGEQLQSDRSSFSNPSQLLKTPRINDFRPPSSLALRKGFALQFTFRPLEGSVSVRVPGGPTSVTSV